MKPFGLIIATFLIPFLPLFSGCNRKSENNEILSHVHSILETHLEELTQAALTPNVPSIHALNLLHGGKHNLCTIYHEKNDEGLKNALYEYYKSTLDVD